MRIVLTRKLAAVINGLDLSHVRVGDVMILPDTVARMLVAEGWAEPLLDLPPTVERHPPNGR